MATTTEPRVSVTDLMSYEDGEMSAAEAVDLFSRLIQTGMAWTLQGAYGRAAATLIEEGILSDSGEVLIDVEDL